MTKKREIVVQLRREIDGKIVSMVVDKLNKGNGSWYFPDGRGIVIDRSNGRQYDQDTVQNRAQSLAEILGVPYEEDLTWPCKAKLGFKDCQCPECAKKADERAKKKASNA